MTRALATLAAVLAIAGALLPAAALADELPPEAVEQWDREDTDTVQRQHWKRTARAMLEPDVEGWLLGNLLPVATGATLVLGGGIVDAASGGFGSGYIMLYPALFLGVSSFVMSWGIWPCFAVAFDIIERAGGPSMAIDMLKRNAKIAAWSALAFGLAATGLALLAFAWYPFAVAAGIAAFCTPFLGHAGTAYGVWAKRFERNLGGRSPRRHPDVEVHLAPTGVVIRF